jgi:tetratricopeptide (TPR) repeat protein
MELKHLAWVALAACVPQTKRLVVPDDMRRLNAGPAVAASAGERPQTEGAFGTGDPTTFALKPAAAAAPSVLPVKTPAAVPALRPPAPSPTPPEQRYVLRLVEHGRVWEVEMPESSGGYEVRIPLGSPVEQPTLADQELLGKEPQQKPAKSYLGAMARIAEMYAAHRYELALIEVVDLEQQYPKEARVEAMKGSLYQKLGKTQLAREAWKKALELDPSDAVVAEALRGLKEE